MRHAPSWLLAVALAVAGCAETVDDPPGEEDQIPTGQDSTLTTHDQTKVRNDAAVSWPRIGYHFGPVLLGTTNIYYIWYGNWAGNTATSILTDLASTIGGSPYFNINTTYYSQPLFGAKSYVSNSVHFAGSINDNYSLGKTLTNAQILTVVTNALNAGKLPKDLHGVYFVLTSADVTESGGFCTSFCGWHNHASIGGSDIKYSFIGNPDQCPSACSAAGGAATPNGNLGADGMASIISHELEETVTDPDINAWFDLFGQENADKCAWTFGTTYTTASGATANMKLGARDFLIQQNWVAGKNVCAQAYP